MARFYGEIGYGESEESPVDSGVWVDDITEFTYFGDVISQNSQLEPGDNLNSDISVGNSISIVANEYAIEHFSKIKYVKWVGECWIVTNVTVQPPRLILTLGGVYNGPTA